MTTDEKLRLAVSVARAAASSGEYRRLDRVIDMVFRKLNQLAATDPDDDRRSTNGEFKL